MSSKNSKSFKKDLEERLKDKTFRNIYQEEKQLADIALTIVDSRLKSGLTQKELADRASITQQQLSRIENGFNSNIMTYIKVFKAIGLSLKFSKMKQAS